MPASSRRVRFKLGQVLLREGRETEAKAQLDAASQLHPDSWTIWRQHAARDAHGLAAGADFWARLDARADTPYYPPADLRD